MKILSLLSFLALFSVKAQAIVEPTLKLTKTPQEVVLKVSLDYDSNFKKAKILELLRPENNNLPELFKDRIVVKGGPDIYDVDMSINIFLGMNQDYKCELKFQEDEAVIFSFENFDKLFKSSIIKVTVTELPQITKVSIVQTATMKPNEFRTISSVPRGEAIFQKKISDNIKNFQISTGGI